MSDQNHSSPKSPALRTIRLIVLFLLGLMVLLVALYAFPTLHERFSFLNMPAASPQQMSLSAMIDATMVARNSQTATRTLPATLVNTPSPTSFIVSQAQIASPTPNPVLPSFEDGLILLAIGEAGYSHLFAFRSQEMPLIRLTNGPWQDKTPALSPDGSQVVFASDRDGYWDLYSLNLMNAEVTRLTYSPEYEAHPTWSPDGLWLAYERYVEGGDGQPSNLDLFVRSAVDPEAEPIRLTFHPGADHSPAWSPLGRQLAFISTRSGENEVWLVDLDQTGERFHNISRNTDHTEVYPAWSPDGMKISWAATDSAGIQNLVLWDANFPDIRPTALAVGEWSAWGPQGNVILASLDTPNQTYLTGYDLDQKGLVLPILPLKGTIHGMTWGYGGLPDELPEAFAAAAQVTSPPPWVPVLQPGGDMPGARRKVVPLEFVEASNPRLHDEIDESYYALRERLLADAGWDYLSVLEESFLPLTSPLEPGMQEDWLYTGRAIRVNTAPLSAGWLEAIKEDYGAKTYWRLFVRARFQDGSQGAPLKEIPWDLSARHSGDPLAYERGGALLDHIPEGYWIDLTDLAVAYGWERQPALSTWRIAYSAVRHNEFYNSSGLDWFSAMLQIYPREALNTPTPVSSPTPSATPTETSTPTETATRTPYLSRTPTVTRTATATRTPKPTNTPWPTATRPPTDTPPASPTPEPSATATLEP